MGVAERPTLQTVLAGTRVQLRPPRPRDARELHELRRVNAAHLAPWNPLAPRDVDPGAISRVREDISRARRQWREDAAYTFLIAARERGWPLIGYVRLSSVERRPFHNAYLGYWMAADRQGHGLMTEAVGLVLSFAFETAGLHRVQAAAVPRNAASRRVLRKAGFREEGMALRYLEIAGRWEDHVLHALTREEWPVPPSGDGYPTAPRARVAR
jgi:[ribosomal protein S5]-alanine N-acetyltransferase